MFRTEETVVDIIRIIIVVVAICLFLPAVKVDMGILQYWSSIINTVPGVLTLISLVVTFFIVGKDSIVFALTPVLPIVISVGALLYKIDEFTKRMHDLYIEKELSEHSEFICKMDYGGYILIFALICLAVCTVVLSVLKTRRQQNSY